MKARIVVRRMEDPEQEGLEQTMTVPDDVRQGSDLDLSENCQAQVENVDLSDPELPHLTVFVDEGDFQMLECLWKASA